VEPAQGDIQTKIIFSDTLTKPTLRR